MKYTIAGDSWRIHMQHSQTPDAPVSDTTEALVVAVDTAVRAAYPTVSWAERYYILADLFEAIEEIPDQASEMPVYTEDPAIPGWNSLEQVEEFKKWWADVTETFIDTMPTGDADFVKMALNIPLLHVVKGLDYGKPGDTFFNIRNSVERVRQLTGFVIPDYIGATLRAADKESRISAFFSRGNLANESVSDAFLDLANYYLIAFRLVAEAFQFDPLTGAPRVWPPRPTYAPVSPWGEAAAWAEADFEGDEDDFEGDKDIAFDRETITASITRVIIIGPDGVQEVKREGPMSEDEVVGYVRQILSDPNRVIQTDQRGKFVGFGNATQAKPVHIAGAASTSTTTRMPVGYTETAPVPTPPSTTPFVSVPDNNIISISVNNMEMAPGGTLLSPEVIERLKALLKESRLHRIAEREDPRGETVA